MAIHSINPATGKIEKSFPEMSWAEVSGALDQAQAAYAGWRETDFHIRSAVLQKAAGILRDRKEYFGALITREMGKPVSQAIAEAEKCALVCEYYAAQAASILGQEVIATDAAESFVRFDPLGVILAVMPWNFPFWQVFRFAAPALMAGNVCVLKHSSNVPMCARAIEDIFREAGLAEHVFQTLLIGPAMVAAMAAHPAVRAATLTGSDHAGRQLAQACGAQLKKTVLELGGSDPFIVLEDADIAAAVKTGITARLVNNGQSCIAAKRFIVAGKVYNEFRDRLVAGMQKIRIGDPMDPATELGPLAREDLLHELDAQVHRSADMGARILCGGKRIGHEGYFYEPGVIDALKKGMPAWDEELFGPVAALVRAGSEDEAIALANDSQFGLGASLWSADIARARNLAARIEAGAVFINGLVKSDPRLPFGGIKNSGYGRELSSCGIKEFVNIKTVWIA